MGFISHRLCSHPKIRTKYVKTDLFWVYSEGEQVSFSSPFQRTAEAQQGDLTRSNTPTRLHTHRTHTSTGLPSPLKEATCKTTSNHF